MSKSLNAGMTGREFSLSELRAAHRHVGTRGGDRPSSPRRQVRHDAYQRDSIDARGHPV